MSDDYVGRKTVESDVAPAEIASSHDDCDTLALYPVNFQPALVAQAAFGRRLVKGGTQS